MDTTLESVVSKELADLYREKYPVTDATEIVVLENLPHYLVDGGYRYQKAAAGRLTHAEIPPQPIERVIVEVGPFERWAACKDCRRYRMAYVPEHDMLFIY